jgi:hypothetical protein
MLTIQYIIYTFKSKAAPCTLNRECASTRAFTYLDRRPNFNGVSSLGKMSVKCINSRLIPFICL